MMPSIKGPAPAPIAVNVSFAIDFSESRPQSCLVVNCIINITFKRDYKVNKKDFPVTSNRASKTTLTYIAQCHVSWYQLIGQVIF